MGVQTWKTHCYDSAGLSVWQVSLGGAVAILGMTLSRADLVLVW